MQEEMTGTEELFLQEELKQLERKKNLPQCVFAFFYVISVILELCYKTFLKSPKSYYLLVTLY